ncbi:MAG: hypothetical protein JWN62_1834 [Acidimicrobiales bacterium]|nr:hypothetical protein [Acidimicrobiales bacterium]
MGRSAKPASSTLRGVDGSIFITGNPDADALLNRDPVALLLGMLLDQQVPMEWAFTGPFTLQARLGHLDASRIARMSEDDFVAVCCARPAIHRFPAAMGKRIHALCDVLTATYPEDVEALWTTAADGAEIYRRLRQLAGFGDEKAKIFIAILGKRCGIDTPGWRAAAGAFGDDVPRSVADIHSPESLAVVREWKRAQKAAKKDKQDRPMQTTKAANAPKARKASEAPTAPKARRTPKA